MSFFAKLSTSSNSDGKSQKVEIKLCKTKPTQYQYQPQWRTTSKEEDLNGRQPQWKITSMEDDLNGRRPQR